MFTSLAILKGFRVFQRCKAPDLRQCVASADRLRAASARSAWALICVGFGYWLNLLECGMHQEHQQNILNSLNLHLISRPFFILPPAWTVALQPQLRVKVLETGHCIHFLWHSPGAASRLPMSWGNLEMCLQLEPCGSFCWMIHGRMVGKIARVGRLKPPQCHFRKDVASESVYGALWSICLVATVLSRKSLWTLVDRVSWYIYGDVLAHKNRNTI